MPKATLTRRPHFCQPQIGSDFELFFRDRNSGDVVPADNLLPSEENGLSTDGDGGLYARKLKKSVYYDGIQAEVRTDPSTCRAYVIDDFVRLFRTLDRVAREGDTVLALEPSVSVTPETLARAKDPISTMFGCSPHRSERLNGNVESIEVDGSTCMTRFAGMHLHFGSDLPTLRTAQGHIRLVRMLDLIVGNTMVMFEGEADRVRREVYGKAGTFRDKSYGLEYRPLSNVLGINPMLVNLAMALGRTALSIVHSNMDAEFAVDVDEVRAAIDNVDKQLAWKNFNKIKANLYASEHSSLYNELQGSGMAAYEFLALTGNPVEQFFVNRFRSSWALDSTTTPFHGNLTQTWREGHMALLAENKDFAEFRSKWSADQEYALTA